MNIAGSEQLDLAGLTARYPAIMAGGRWRAARVAFACFALVASVVAGFASLDISWSRFFGGFAELARIIGLMVPPDCGNTARLLLWLKALGETLSIALLGTVAGAVLAFPVSLLAARNITPGWPVRFTIRRGLDTIRGVNTLIWALIWINVIGLGPFAGVLAIMTTDFGTFGKLFSEAFEAADPKQGEGVVAAGGGELHRVRFGLIPQILPVLLSQILYLIESNTRSATIIGIVGAGGIGQHLTEAIRTLEWQQVAFLVLMILVTVAVIDFISSRVRFAIIGEPPASGHAT
jgi:phosphonate transport system permease protein